MFYQAFLAQQRIRLDYEHADLQLDFQERAACLDRSDPAYDELLDDFIYEEHRLCALYDLVQRAISRSGDDITL